METTSNTKPWYIKCRYEHYTREGKQWTNWFIPYWGYCNTEDEANKLLKKAVNDIKTVDKATKLKHEFLIEKSE